MQLRQSMWTLFEIDNAMIRQELSNTVLHGFLKWYDFWSVIMQSTVQELQDLVSLVQNFVNFVSHVPWEFSRPLTGLNRTRVLENCAAWLIETTRFSYFVDSEKTTKVRNLCGALLSHKDASIRAKTYSTLCDAIEGLQVLGTLAAHVLCLCRVSIIGHGNIS